MSVEVAIETAREENSMISENIKALLGEELAAQVDAALRGKGKDGKDVDVVVGNDGSYVPAEKYDGMKGQADSAEKTMKAVADALKNLGGSGDPAKLADDLKTAQGTVDTLKNEHKTEMEKLRKATALRIGLAGKVHDPDDVISRLDMSAVEVDEAGGLKSNLEEMLKPIQTAKPYLFKPVDPAPELKGAKPAVPSVHHTEKPVDQMTYTELAAYMAANPGATI